MINEKYFLNNRFSDFYDSLIKSKKVKNKLELASILDIKPSTISEILAKRQGITIEFIKKFCDSFPDYMPNDFFFDNYCNQNEIISNSSEENFSYKNKEEEIIRLRITNEEQLKRIALLEKIIKLLENKQQ